MAGIVERSVASVNEDSSTTTYTVGKPTGTTSGDVLIGVVGTIVAGTLTPPSGWTSIILDSADTNVRLQAWYKVAGGSEPSTYAWTTPSSKGFGWIGCYQNVDNTTPVDASNDGNVSAVNTATASATAATAGAWLVTVAIGRHGFAAARSIATSDGSDASRYAHGSSSVSGFDYAGAVWDSSRDLGATAASRVLTTNVGTENALVWLAVMLRPATPAALKGRITQAYLTAPQALPPLRARITQASLTTPAPSGGRTARIVQASLTAPLPTGSPGKSGISVAQGGNIRRVAIYSAKNGQVV